MMCDEKRNMNNDEINGLCNRLSFSNPEFDYINSCIKMTIKAGMENKKLNPLSIPKYIDLFEEKHLQNMTCESPNRGNTLSSIIDLYQKGEITLDMINNQTCSSILDTYHKINIDEL